MTDESIDQPTQVPPHIRVNSGQHDPFEDVEIMHPPPRPQSIGRALTPGMVPSNSSGTIHTVYGSPVAQDSTEFLIPPRPPRHREDFDSMQSPNLSMVSSRRTSWSSGDTRKYSYTWMEDSRAPSRAGSDENDVNTQTVTEKFNIMPTEGLLLFPEDVEKDDYLHNPDPNEREKDCDIWNRRGMINVGGLVLLTLGFIVLFVGYPIMYEPTLPLSWLVFLLTAARTAVTKLEKGGTPVCEAGDTLCLDVGERPILSNLRTGLIDPDTPESVKTKKSVDGKEWKLVVSLSRQTYGCICHVGMAN